MTDLSYTGADITTVKQAVFTESDRAMIAETHKAITEIRDMIREIVPTLQGNPILRMLAKRS